MLGRVRVLEDDPFPRFVAAVDERVLGQPGAALLGHVRGVELGAARREGDADEAALVGGADTVAEVEHDDRVDGRAGRGDLQATYCARLLRDVLVVGLARPHGQRGRLYERRYQLGLHARGAGRRRERQGGGRGDNEGASQGFPHATDDTPRSYLVPAVSGTDGTLRVTR